METHVELGLAIIDKILGEFALEALADSHVLRASVGEQIPREARIMAVADVLDAFTSPPASSTGTAWRRSNATPAKWPPSAPATRIPTPTEIALQDVPQPTTTRFRPAALAA